MDILRVDRISGTPENVLSLVIYSFFPASHRHFVMIDGTENYQLHAPYTGVMEESDVEYILTGSKSEYLLLPPLIGRNENPADPVFMAQSDTDVMFNPGLFKDIYDTMSLEMDKRRPVYCRIRHGKSQIPNVEMMVKGPYLNSAAILEDFRKYLSGGIDERTLTFTEGDGSSAFSTVYSKTFSKTQVFNNSQDELYCIPVKCQSSVKHTFLTRLDKQKWPMNSVKNLDYLLSEQLYVIPKPDPWSDTGDLRWRLSFSVIEVELARSLSEIQRRCYRVLKALIKFSVNDDLNEDRKFPSYFLKTSMFWLCEGTSETSFTFENLGNKWSELVENLIESLEKKKLPHYFVPSHNLLDDKPQSDINCWKDRLRQIRNRPLDACIKFWSKYVTVDLNGLKWGDKFCEILKKVNGCLKNITDRNQIIMIKTNLEELKCVSTMFLLFSYNLTDYLRLYPLTPIVRREQLCYSDIHPKEQFIWMLYCQTIVNLHKSGTIHPEWWAHLAEVTHHMVRKYEDHVPLKILFSTKTAEKFHLIACSIHTDNNSHMCAKYANYLRAEKEYEAALVLLINLCAKGPNMDCVFNNLTSYVVDISIKLQMALQHDICYSDSFLAYHLLVCCYLHSGSLAEVCFPEGLERPLSHEKLNEKEILSKPCLPGKYCLQGYQYITSGQLVEAFGHFDSISDKNVLDAASPHNIKYKAMLFILARFISLH